jgi:rhodanese-related sulfurtransferase
MKTALVLCFATSLALMAVAQDSSTKSSPSPGRTEDTKVKRIDVEEFDKLRGSKTNTVLDVRTEKEFKADHIPGAINIDVNSPDFAQKIEQLDKSKTYLVHCAAGVRSARACQKMEGLGFTNLYDLAPGFKGWEKAGKPVEK